MHNLGIPVDVHFLYLYPYLHLHLLSLLHPLPHHYHHGDADGRGGMALIAGTIAAERKSAMLLLPYGIPIAIGSIAYFVWTGMLP